jgi:hypothetical protein
MKTYQNKFVVGALLLWPIDLAIKLGLVKPEEIEFDKELPVPFKYIDLALKGNHA